MTTPTQTEAAVLRDAIAVLREARKLLECGWCQGALARNAENEKGLLCDSSACSWCVAGALKAAAMALTGLGDRWVRLGAKDRARRLLRSVIGLKSITQWNDDRERTQAEVLEAVDRAVELGEQELAKLEGGER